ncbi:MAG: 3-methyl-2-oxobutanoate hydroxymethyltransferase [Myxococcota bacterium]|nr:3-methyl-2-oxobutanoate hydroxymethyltransferase [Myxococcota bacterium]
MPRLTTINIQDMKTQGDPIAMVTAYDASFARLLDESGVDMLLVGDSLGMVIQGHDNTLSVTMDQMVYHTQAVTRGSRRAFVVADMPFMSYQASVDDAVRNAGRLLAEGACQAVKLEGGARSAEAVKRIVEAGIPVMGHIGLTPQSVHTLGGFKVQGRGPEQSAALLEDARALQEAGAFSLVLETVPGDLARQVTEQLSIPTVGIGAGIECDGQVLVSYDLLGLMREFSPRFLKRYAEMGDDVHDAVRAYVSDVKARQFPGPEHTFE